MIGLMISLKITRGREIRRRPVFICKGRRIGEIKAVDGQILVLKEDHLKP